MPPHSPSHLLRDAAHDASSAESHDAHWSPRGSSTVHQQQRLRGSPVGGSEAKAVGAGATTAWGAAVGAPSATMATSAQFQNASG